ncbi:MAG TPA: hydroxyisourate hydrolase [Natronosporangium sp.]|nr:hydroxyisourate hydrolase [Natronosporangium sp.]
MSITADVVDCVFGRPAEGVHVTVQREVDGQWQEYATGRSGATGRVGFPPAPERGRYRAVFELDQYFAGLGLENFQSQVGLVFRVGSPDEEIGLLLLISPSATSVCRVADGAVFPV